jgi:hypothetical protein
VAGQDDAGGLAFPQRGEQVGLGLFGVEGQAARDAELLQLVAHEMDELEVRVDADRVHADQRLREFERAGGQGACLHSLILPDPA